MLTSHILYHTYKKVSRSLSVMTVLAVIFSLLGPAFLLAPLPALAAATVDVNAFGLTNGNFPGAPIKASSSAVAITKVKVNPTATATLTSVTVQFSGTGFATTTLADIATDNTSGVALYSDGGTADSFGAGDSAITLAAISGSGWTGLTSNITLTPASAPSLTANQNNIYYVVIKTASGAVNGTRIAATIGVDGVVTSAGNGPSTAVALNDLLVDTTAPTIASATGYVGQTGVTVTFSEPVQKTGGGNLAYTAVGTPFTIASSTIASISHTAGSNVATLTMTPALATGDLALSSANTIRASSTTSTIIDMAGNNMTASPVAFTSPLSITTAAIPSTYTGAVFNTTTPLATLAAAGGASASYSWIASSTSQTLLSDLGLAVVNAGGDAGKITGTVANTTGSFGVTFDVGDGTATSTKNFVINISATNVSSVPGIASVSPPGAGVGTSNLTVTITGSNTSFSSSSYVQFLLPVGVTGTNGIATSTMTAVSATSLTIVATIAAGATQGNRDLKITTGTQTVFLPNAFGIGAAAGSGLNLQFPTSGATGVQIPPGFSFTPSANSSLTSYRVTVKSTSDFSGAAIWDYAFPKPDASYSNGSHCSATSCNVTFGEGRFKIITQPASLAPGTTYYWNVRTYGVSTDLLSATDTQVPLEGAASRSFTISNSIADTAPATIAHRPVFQATASTDANLYARVIDNLANASTTPALVSKIFYCAGAGCTPSSNATGTSVGSGYYNFTIPAATVSSANTIIRYYLRADDGTNLSYASAGGSATSTPPYQLTAVAAGSSTSIAGTVKDSSNNNLAGALVFAEGTAFVAASSAANGTFTFGSNNLLAGTYDLVALKNGYADRSMTGLPTGATGLVFSLPAGGGGGFGGDSTRPRIKFHGPMDGMNGIPGGDSNFKIFVVFDKTMSQSAVATSTTMTVKEINPATGDTTDITTSKGSWTYYTSAPSAGTSLPAEANMAVWSFSGANTFGDGKTIAVTVTPNVTDTAGNAIQGNQSDGSYVFSFVTGSTANFTGFNTTTGGFSGGGTFGSGAFMPPRVIGTTPPPGGFAVPTNTKVVINFSDAMADDAGSYILKNYVKLYTVSGTTETDVSSTALSTVALDSAKLNATITLSNSYNSGAFAASSSYRLKVLGGAKASSGMTLAQPGQEATVMFTADFKTGTGADTDNPAVVGVYPSNGATSVPVNVGAVNVGFNKDMSSSTITNSTFSLSVGSTSVNGTVEYRALERQAYFIPKGALTPNTKYTLTVAATIQGLNSQTLTATTTIFTTGAGDTGQPKVTFASADDYNLAITFSEPMNSAKATDSLNWPTSVLNPTTYDVIEYGAAGFATSTAGTTVSLTGGTFSYDTVTNTVNIKGLALTSAVGQELYVSFDSTGTNAPKDLSGNVIETASLANTARATVQSSATTKGMLGPGAMTGDAFSSGGGFTPTNFSSSTFGFAPPIEVRPFNTMAGQTTIYGVRLPISKQIPDGGKVVLTFPTGFDVTSAQQDVNSPMRRDINGPGTGAPTFKCQTNSTAINGKSCGGGAANSDDTGAAGGGLADDGVVVDVSARTVTVYISGATGSTNDFLTIDVSGIKNSTVPKDFNTAGYTVDVKTKNGATILESLTSAPIFIQSAGSYTLSGTITATSNDQSATMKVYLMSPMTGPLEATSAGFAAGETAAYSFSNLPAGDFMLFTDQTITLDGVEASSKEYTGKTIPERVVINETTDLSSDSSNNDVIDYDFTLASNTAGGTNVTISINGPNAEMLDIFAGSPTGFKVKQVTLDSSAGAENFTLNLGDGDWFVGVGPQMPKGFSTGGPPPAPAYLPPKPKNIKVAGSICTQESGTIGCSLTYTLTTSNRAIRGIVKDGAGKVMANAQVFAYSSTDGFGTGGQSDTAGAFTLNVVDGTYKVGSFVPGMPPSKEVPVVVNSDTAKSGHATNYLFIDGATTGVASTTAATTFILKVAKPDYTISGKVTDGTNVVQGASVYSYRTDGPGHANALTDSSGNYTVYVTAGSWKVGVFLPQYGQLTEQTVTVTTASQSNINFAPSGTGTFYTVSGNVKVGGTNRQGAFVRLSGNSTFNEAITDSSGNYSFKVPAGNGYVVRAFIPGIGETAPLASFNVAADTTGKDLSIGAANTITFNISPATTAVTKALVDLFSSTGVGGHAEMINATSTTASLPNGSYKVNVNIPGIVIGLTDISAAGGAYSSTSGILTVDGAETVTITLPTLRTVSGTATDGTNNLSDVWVEIVHPSTGVHFGAKTGSDGTFSLKVADSAVAYIINAMKPGYFREPSSLTVNGANQTGQTLTVSAASTTIGGTITAGGTAAANAFVRAEKQGGGFSGTQADANGVYSLPVSAGVWSVYAVSEGYAEVRYPSVIDVSAGSVTGKDIALTATVSLNAPKSKSITPASGGTLEDTTAGVKLTIPANALGSSTSSGNVQAKETNNVRETSSAKPVGGKAKDITATDSSGNPITTLNDSITVEMTYTKAELAATASGGDSSINTKAEADALSMAYWDETTANWVTIATNVTYKDSSGNVITDATTIDTAAEFDTNVASVTIGATTDHFSLYAPVVGSDPTPAAVPSGLAGTGNLANQINLTWTAVSGATSYDVYRSTTENGTYSRLGAEPTTTGASYINTGLPAGTTYYYKVTSISDSGESSPSAPISAWTAGSSATSGGAITTAPVSSPASSQPAPTPAANAATPATPAKGATPAPAASALADNLAKVVSEAATIAQGGRDALLAAIGKVRDTATEGTLNKSVVSKVVSGIKTVKAEVKEKILNFVTYGTATTDSLGAGERGGVVNSFKEAFGKLPESDKDWEDVVKIGNGRWPSQTNKTKETAAIASFRSIYKRTPDRTKPNDDAAVVVMAYGLRPRDRNLTSEAAAIKTYKSVFGKTPTTATAWDTVRAIAYSGAKR